MDTLTDTSLAPEPPSVPPAVMQLSPKALTDIPLQTDHKVFGYVVFFKKARKHLSLLPLASALIAGITV